MTCDKSAVGFGMLISQKVIDAIGPEGPAFDEGYGVASGGQRSEKPQTIRTHRNWLMIPQRIRFGSAAVRAAARATAAVFGKCHEEPSRAAARFYRFLLGALESRYS
jgi:hypothetical protein